eukprot:s9434_g2.t1
MPVISGYKDYKIPDELPTENPEPDDPHAEEQDEDAGGVGSMPLERDDDLFDEVKEAAPERTREDNDEMEVANEEYQKLFKEIKDTLSYQNLHFMVPLKSRVASEVEAAIRFLYIQLRLKSSQSEIPDNIYIMVSGNVYTWRCFRAETDYAKDASDNRVEAVKLQKQEYVLDEDGALETFVKEDLVEEEEGAMDQQILKVMNFNNKWWRR